MGAERGQTGGTIAEGRFEGMLWAYTELTTWDAVVVESIPIATIEQPVP